MTWVPIRDLIADTLKDNHVRTFVGNENGIKLDEFAMHSKLSFQARLLHGGSLSIEEPLFLR